jgi:SAM-dependent methyltransferase
MFIGAEPAGTATFRDPAGSLQISGEEVLRTVNAEYAEEAVRFLGSEIAARLVDSGKLISSSILHQAKGQPLQLQHPRVFFPSYPWEWTPAQLSAAGELTLDLCESLLDAGWILKDATPLNILFDTHRPVFVDVLSVERRNPNNPIWLAYGQFARTFLLPLAAHKYLGWPMNTMLSRRDGYEPADLYPHLALSRRLRAPLRSLVTIPWLMEKKQKRRSTAPPQLRQRPEIAAAVLRGNLRGLRKALRVLKPKASVGRWSQYTDWADHYSEEDQNRKQSFVRRAIDRIQPAFVLDIGANTGNYSRIAAETGAQVIAWDTDTGACESNWTTASERKLPISALVADAARPTPAVGWRNTESLSLLERARGRFDCVLTLGILHHLLVTERIPLNGIAEYLSTLTRRWLVAEWIPKTDIRFQEICRGRDGLYAHLDEAALLASFAPSFHQIEREELQNGRVLFLFEKR